MNKKIFGLPIGIFLIGLVVISGASAALLSAFGVISLNASVDQAVLVDGGDYLQINDDNLEIVAGSSECMLHLIENQADIDIDIALETVVEEGIDVTYQIINNVQQLTQDDFSESSFGFDVEIVKEENELIVTVTDSDLTDVYYPYATIIMMDENKDFKYNTGFSSEALLNSWDGMYKAYNIGWGSAEDVSGYPITVDRTLEQVVISIPSSMYDESDLIGLNVEGIGSGPAIQSKYPVDLTWNVGNGITMVEYSSLLSPFTMNSETSMNFNICYDFAANLASGDYPLETEVSYIELGSA